MLISIVICVLNREKDIKKVLDSLLSQLYSEIEVIFVDNGSTDSTVEIIRKCKDQRVILADGSEFLGSPYSARNMGISLASGDVIAFMDGYPENTWVLNAVEFMKQGHFDIVAGRVILPTDKTSSIYEIYDSIFSLDVMHMVSKYSSAPTANLLIKKTIFDHVGCFDENIRSGGDILLTSTATKLGYRIGFCDNARSFYFTRDRSGLIEKQKRIAKGQVHIWRKRERVKIEVFKTLIKFVIPFNPISTRSRIINNSNTKVKLTQIIMLYMIRHKLDRIRLYNNLLEAVKGGKKK
ncbi:glycosyltransferase [Vibrio fluvialis]|nr:glycosyltransferase [Vibrio fluvialis]